MLGLTEKCFKTAIKNTFTELHKGMIREVKEAMTVLNQININKKIEIVYKKRINGNSEVEKVIEIKNSEVLNGRYEK